MQKAFATLIIKQVDEEKRILRGIATTGSRDRVNDSIDPMGVTFPPDGVPLLLGHDHSAAVGTAKFFPPTRAGVEFEARLPKVAEPGVLKDRVDEAFQSAKYGILRSVSVGFRPLDDEIERLPGGGVLWKRIEIMELSLVPVPANPDAKILEVRAARLSRRRDIPKEAPPEKLAPKFVSAATRRKQRGGTIVDEKRYVRNARRALALKFGEKSVPHFQSLAALERWDDDKQLSAIARGVVWLGYEAITRAAPKAKATPVVRLRDTVVIRSIR